MSFKKYLPYFVKTAGVIAPAWVAQFAFNLFVTPDKIKRPQKEEAFWSRCKPVQTISGAHCRSIGSGPEVWFVHGWAGRGSQFYVMANAVANAGYTAICWDGPAHGDTGGDKTNLIQYSTWLREDLESRPTPPTAIVGHSFGGCACVHLVGTGFKVSRLVSIAAPAIMYRVFTTYWKNIQLPKRAQEHFLRIARETTGADVHTMNAEYLKDKTATQIMIVHDEGDKEVIFDNTNVFKNVRPDLELFVTRNLGHRRILHSELVAEKLVSFLQSTEKNIS